MRVNNYVPRAGVQFGSSGSGHSSSPQMLQPGSAVSAEVLRALGSARFVVAINGTEMEALSSQDLQPGREYRLQVESLQPVPRLKVVKEHAGGPDGEALLSRLLARFKPLRQSLGHLLKVLPPLDTPSGSPTLDRLRSWIGRAMGRPGPPDASQLATLVRFGGLQYEHQISRLAQQADPALASLASKDLKALLLGALNDQPARADASLARGLLELLDQIEARQAANLIARQNGEPYRFDIPFFDGNELTTAYLAVKPHSQPSTPDSEEGGRAYRVLCLLELQGWGSTRIDTYLTDHSIDSVFYLEASSELQGLSHQLPVLRQKLLAFGFSRVTLAARLLESAAAEKRREFDTVFEVIPKGLSLVDLVV